MTTIDFNDENVLLAGGDSFTAHLMESNVAWPNHIKKWIADTKVVAEMASDNEVLPRVRGLR